jgi:type VI secretion system protein ImpL
LDRDEIERQDASVVFEAEYQRLYESLLSMRSRRLNRSMKRQDRQKVYVFPLEFAAAQENLSIFVARLFQPNPYQESPVFRGFYFSSGTQEGAPIDHVIQSIARQFDLTPERAWQQSVMETEAKSYFIKDLFTDVIVPDQYMVRQTTRRVLQGHLARAGVGVAAVLLLALWIIGLSQAVFRSQSQLSRVGEAAMMVAPVRWQSQDGVENELENMETLLAQIERIEADLHRFRPLQMGLDRSVAVLEPARRLYLDRARAFVQMQSFQEIQSRLDTSVRMRGTERTNRDALHDDFRAYLLMTRERARLREEADRMFLARHLTGPGGSAEGAMSGANRHERINRQLRAYVDGLARGHVEPFADDEFLISRVRSLIYEPPSIDRTYRRIREEGEAALGAVTLADVLQGRNLDMFSTRPEVPAVFTKRGWATFVEEAIDDAAAGTGQLDYVMGHSDADRPEQMQDRDRLKEQLRQAYFTDYATMWERFLRSVRVARVNDLRSGVRLLTELSSPYESPLLYVLAQVSHQTRFEEEGLVDGLAGRAADVAARRAERAASRVIGQSARIERDQSGAPAHPVDRRFARLHELAADRAESGDAAPGLQRAIQSLGSVAGALEELQGNPALAAGFAERVFAQNGADLAMHLQTINSNLPNLDPDVRTALFIDPVIGAWEAILAETQRQLNDRWVAEVYEPCRAMASRYPLDLNSTADAPLDQFEKFFHPENGAIDVFFKETLARYLTPDRRQGRSWNGRGISVSPAVFETARASSRIGEALFSGGVLRTEFQIQAEVPVYADGAPRASLVEIDVHGRSDSYDMGGYRPWADFAWPGRSGARIRVETRTGPVTRDFSGDWAFFRMLQDAQVQRVSQTEYDLRWPLEDGLTVRYQLRTRSSNNPFGDLRGFFRLECPATL